MPVAGGSETPPRLSNGLILGLLLVLAALFRLPSLDSPGLVLDELWTAEIASGRGSVHVSFPLNQLIQPPDLFHLSTAPPWWNVWTHMQVTHPPLYYIFLRLWMNGFGEGDFPSRLFSVVTSLMAIGFLFDAARLTSGRYVAVWACLLMAVAPLQIDFARKVRNYSMGLAVLLAAVDALVRMEKLGVRRRRLLALALTTLAAPLTHYLSIGAIVGLALYSCIRFRGKQRVQLLISFAMAGIVFMVIWGPFFYQQRSLFSVDDPGVSFVKDSPAGHVQRVVQLALLVPSKMLVPRVNLNTTAYLLALLYVVPLLLLRKRADLLLWTLLLQATVGVLMLLDLTRSSLHLGFVRYLIFAGPAVYVLVPATAAAIGVPRWFKHAMPLAAILLCLYFSGDGYFEPAADPRVIARHLRPSVGPDDLLVFASSGDFAWARGVQAMMISRYLSPIPCPILFLDQPPSDALRQKLLAARTVILFTSSQGPMTFLPGFMQASSVTYASWGTISILVGPVKHAN